MSTRVTQGMMNSQLLRNVNSNLSRMNILQDQLSTGRRINKPSDDPVGITFSMRYRSELSANTQYQSNVDAATSWLDFTDITLNQAGDVTQRARELAVQAANGTNSQSSMDAMKAEIDQLYNQMVTIGNSEFNGKHVFNGQMTDKTPYSAASADTDPVDGASINFEIGTGVKMAVNVSGSKAFGVPDDPAHPGTNDNVFRILKDLSQAISTSNYTNVSTIIGRLDSNTDGLLQVRADVGAKMNRIDLAKSRLTDVDSNLQSLQTKTEDADIAQVITNLKADENVYQASLSVGAKLISPSLVDFLH